MMALDAYPGPLPLAREHVRALLSSRTEAANLRATYVTFVMIPVEERIGEWRFAGVASTLAMAFETIGRFGVAMAADPSDKEWRDFVNIALDNLDWPTTLEAACLFESSLIEELPSARVVTYCEGGAPYDDVGLCVVETASIAGTRYEGLAPETPPPEPDAEDDDDGDA